MAAPSVATDSVATASVTIPLRFIDSSWLAFCCRIEPAMLERGYWTKVLALAELRAVEQANRGAIARVAA
jgi:hypothetical protein